MVVSPTSGTAESPCFAGMILVIASRAMPTALSALVLTVCTITGLLLEAGRLLADRSGSPPGCSVQCIMTYEFMLLCTRVVASLAEFEALADRRAGENRHAAGQGAKRAHIVELLGQGGFIQTSVGQEAGRLARDRAAHWEGPEG